MAVCAGGWPKDWDGEYAVSQARRVEVGGLLGALSQPGDSASFLGSQQALGRCPCFFEEHCLPSSLLVFLHLLWPGK